MASKIFSIMVLAGVASLCLFVATGIVRLGAGLFEPHGIWWAIAAGFWIPMIPVVMFKWALKVWRVQQAAAFSAELERHKAALAKEGMLHP